MWTGFDIYANIWLNTLNVLAYFDSNIFMKMILHLLFIGMIEELEYSYIYTLEKWIKRDERELSNIKF